MGKIADIFKNNEVTYRNISSSAEKISVTNSQGDEISIIKQSPRVEFSLVCHGEIFSSKYILGEYGDNIKDIWSEYMEGNELKKSDKLKDVIDNFK